MTKRRTKPRDPDEDFRVRLIAAGAEMLGPTNPYEVMRFRTSHGVGVIYQKENGRRTWNAEAKAAQRHIEENLGSLAPVKTQHARVKGAGTRQALLKRDGADCFFCRHPLGDDMTIEHLVARAHGGPNHISNLFLAHAGCNHVAGHLSAPEKIAMREAWVKRAVAA